MHRWLGLALILFVALGAGASGQTSPWKKINLDGAQGDILQGIDFPTPTMGFAIGWAPGPQGQTALARSTDAGKTWSVSHTIGVLTFDLDFTDASNGYVVGQSATCNCGIILQTWNGGGGWSSQTFENTGTLYSVFFLDNQLGFAAGDRSTILRTTNGGANWTRVTTPADDSIAFKSIHMASASVGYATAQSGQFGWTTKIYKTTDGGLTWSKIQDGGNNNEKVFVGFDFLSETLGFAAGGSRTETVYKTTDGGMNWTLSYKFPTDSGNRVLRAVDFVDENNGYAVGDFGFVVRTTNGGANWTREDSKATLDLYDVDFIDAKTGVAVGLLGTVVRREGGEARPSAVVSPNVLDFGLVETGSKELSVTLSAANEAGLRLESLEIKDAIGKPASGFSIVEPAGTSPVTIAMGSPLTIRVKFTPSQSGETDIRSDLILKTNDPNRANIYVTLRAQQPAGEAPAAILSATKLEFGKVIEKGSKELTFTLSAANAAGVRLDSFYIVDKVGTSNGFSVTTPAAQFPKDVNGVTPLTFTIRFAPALAGGPVESELTLKTNDASQPERKVLLTGEGVESIASVGGRDAEASLALDVQPNPIASTGELVMTIPTGGHLTVELFDALGKRIALLHDGAIEAGRQGISLDATPLPAGVYYCVMDVDGVRRVKEIVVER